MLERAPEFSVFLPQELEQKRFMLLNRAIYTIRLLRLLRITAMKVKSNLSKLV